MAESEFRVFGQISVSYTHLDVYKRQVRVCRENRLANCTNDALELWCQAAQRAEVYFKKGYTIPSSRDFFEVVDEEYYKALERPVPSINTPESPSGSVSYTHLFVIV